MSNSDLTRNPEASQIFADLSKVRLLEGPRLCQKMWDTTVITRLYDGVAHLVAHLKVYSRLGNLVRDDHELMPMERSIADFYRKCGDSISTDEEWRPVRFARGPDGGQATHINAT